MCRAVSRCEPTCAKADCMILRHHSPILGVSVNPRNHVRRELKDFECGFLTLYGPLGYTKGNPTYILIFVRTDTSKRNAALKTLPTPL